jgi:hypothetical protein
MSTSEDYTADEEVVKALTGKSLKSALNGLCGKGLIGLR